MTAKTNPYPDVRLPAGAELAPNDGWATWNNACRVFRGAERCVLNGAAEVVAEVRAHGVQLPDGSVDNGEDAPTIDLYLRIGELDSADALRLADVLVECVAEVDGWIAGSHATEPGAR
jgi:hypothetical protein